MRGRGGGHPRDELAFCGAVFSFVLVGRFFLGGDLQDFLSGKMFLLRASVKYSCDHNDSHDFASSVHAGEMCEVFDDQYHHLSTSSDIIELL